MCGVVCGGVRLELLLITVGKGVIVYCHSALVVIEFLLSAFSEGSGGDRPSSMSLRPTDATADRDRDRDRDSGVTTTSSYSPPPNSNSFQWIQASYNLTKMPSSAQTLNETQLKKAWNISELLSATDWHAWFKRFLIELIRESPSPFLRACVVLAQAHFPFARELFQAAFVSCWKELCNDNRDSLIATLQVALQADTFPTDILLVFLNLAEFMEHYVNALPIEPQVLAGLAEKSLAFAKALHYRELEFQSSPSSCFGSLIRINRKLNIFDGAMGVQRKMQKMNEREAMREGGKNSVKDDMLMSLEKWDEALVVYDKELQV